MFIQELWHCDKHGDINKYNVRLIGDAPYCLLCYAEYKQEKEEKQIRKHSLPVKKIGDKNEN